MTGTFDDWARSEKLEKKDRGFEKLVDLPQAEEKILYKVREYGLFSGSCTVPWCREHKAQSLWHLHFIKTAGG